MERRVSRSAEAKRDVIEIADYIAQRNFTAALEFLDVVENTFQFLAANREAGQLCRYTDPDTEVAH